LATLVGRTTGVGAEDARTMEVCTMFVFMPSRH
jgi:hypothetical protein